MEPTAQALSAALDKPYFLRWHAELLKLLPNEIMQQGMPLEQALNEASYALKGTKSAVFFQTAIDNLSAADSKLIAETEALYQAGRDMAAAHDVQQIVAAVGQRRPLRKLR